MIMIMPVILPTSFFLLTVTVTSPEAGPQLNNFVASLGTGFFFV